MSKLLIFLFFALTAKVFCVCLHKYGNYYKVYHHNKKIYENNLSNEALKKYFQIENKTKKLALTKHENIIKRDNLNAKSTTEVKKNIKNETRSTDKTHYVSIYDKTKMIMLHKPLENVKKLDNAVTKSSKKITRDMRNATKSKDVSEYDNSNDEKFLSTFFNGSRKDINKDNETTTQNYNINEVKKTSDIPLISHIDEKYNIVIKNCVLGNNEVKLNISQMPDIWETVYYDLPNKVRCFKMHIKKVTARDQKRYGRMYGTFNGKVKWDYCNLEIESSKLRRKHFLQGDDTDNGVLENIVLKEDGNSVSLVQAEGPDQWMVTKNLLLMRDCETGHVAVFSRVPFTPSRFDVVEALKMFGEDVVIGKIACDEDENIVSKLNRPVFENNYKHVNDDVLLGNYFKF